MEKSEIIFHKNNRKKLLKLFSEGLIIVKAGDEYPPLCDIPYAYQQDAYFFYLTGVELPHHTLVLDTKTKKSHLFIPDLDDHYRLWIGKQHTKQTAKKAFGPDHTHYQADFDRILKTLSRKHKTLYFTPADKSFGQKIKTKLKKNFKLLKQQMDQLRVIKDKTEIQYMKKAAQVNELGFTAALKAIPFKQREFEIQAALEQQYTGHGAFIHAFPSIVAAGRNAATIHYMNNNAPIKKGDLVLIDAGCRWKGYSSDLTRTYPSAKRFTKKQKEIYQIVLDAQKASIQAIKPGLYTPDLQKMAAKILMSGLIKLGIIKKGFDLDFLFDRDVHRIFFPHGIGHLLGLDVHDVGAPPNLKVKNLRSVITLKAGMILTVEPGIYFVEGLFKSPQKRKLYSPYINWRVADSYYSVGGIRIEDNILVTKTGHINLTKLPKEIKDIERLMK